MVDLLPCPRGCDVAPVIRVAPGMAARTFIHRVVCPRCEWSGPPAKSTSMDGYHQAQDRAAELWNERS
jgi:hypothetical protein